GAPAPARSGPRDRGPARRHRRRGEPGPRRGPGALDLPDLVPGVSPPSRDSPDAAVRAVARPLLVRHARGRLPRGGAGPAAEPARGRAVPRARGAPHRAPDRHRLPPPRSGADAAVADPVPPARRRSQAGPGGGRRAPADDRLGHAPDRSALPGGARPPAAPRPAAAPPTR